MQQENSTHVTARNTLCLSLSHFFVVAPSLSCHKLTFSMPLTQSAAVLTYVQGNRRVYKWYSCKDELHLLPEDTCCLLLLWF